jgi:UDP-glucose 4-epimerase
MNRILVTGAAGLIGSNFVRHAISSGYKVVGIDNLSGGFKEFLPKSENFYLYKLDILNTRKINKIFDKFRPEIVYHFAAYAAEGLSPFIRKYNYENNVLGSMSLINASINFESKLIYTSSMAVYGGQDTPFTEEMALSPVDPYGIAKMAVEADIKVANEQFGLRYNILRPHNVIGKYQNIWDAYRNVLGIFIRQTLSHEPLTIYGDGSQLRAFSDVKLISLSCLELADNYDNQIFNIGSDTTTSILDLATMVQKTAQQFGFTPKIIFLDKRHEVKDAFSDHSKFKKFFNQNDETNLESIIFDMFKWALSVKPKKIRKMNYEVTKNIYKNWI